MSEVNYSKIDKQIKKLNDAEDITGLYDNEIVKWTGPQSTSKQPYTDYVAKKLLELNPVEKMLKPLKGISKRKKYFETSHNGVNENFNDSSEEKIFAKSLYGHNIENLGRVLDYEVPLSERKGESKNAKRYGDIDLISFDSKKNVLYLIELKRPSKENTYETLLRASLEIATYGHIADRSVLEEHFKQILKHRYKNHSLYNHLNKDFSVRLAVLYATSPTAGLPQELRPENRGRYPNLFKLLHELNVGVFTIDYHYPTNIHNSPW